MSDRTSKGASCIVGILLLFALSCSDRVKPGSVEVKRQQVTGVTLAAIAPVPVDVYYEAAGTVKPAMTSILSARVTGTVRSIKVQEGQRVKAGQTLLLLDDRDAVQRQATAESGHKEAERALDEAVQRQSLADVTYKRYRNLAEDRVITPQEMDQVETQKKVTDIGYLRAVEGVNRAKAQLEESRLGREHSRVTAPFAGLVTEKKIEEGSLATPGTPLFLLEDTSRYRVDVYLDERLAPVVKTGLAVPVILTAQGKQITGTLAEIVHAVDPATRTFLAKVSVNDPSLRSGLFARVLIPEGKKQVLLVPRNAVKAKGQLTGLYVVDDKGVMTYRIVKTGSTYGDRVEIVSGLRGNEQVTVAGLDNAIDGGQVKR